MTDLALEPRDCQGSWNPGLRGPGFSLKWGWHH